MLKDQIARMYRALPRFRGKGRLGLQIQRLLFSQSGDDNLVSLKMGDGSTMTLDLRSGTERIAFWTGYYDEEAIDFLKSRLSKGAVFLDVGANIGFYSISLGCRLRSIGGRVFAFEPVPSNFSRLVSLIKTNYLTDNVSAIQVALGEAEGQVEVSLDDQNHASTGNGVVSKENVSTSSNAIRVCKLDSIYETAGIEQCDVIKS